MSTRHADYTPSSFNGPGVSFFDPLPMDELIRQEIDDEDEEERMMLEEEEEKIMKTVEELSKSEFRDKYGKVHVLYPEELWDSMWEESKWLEAKIEAEEAAALAALESQDEMEAERQLSMADQDRQDMIVKWKSDKQLF